MRLEIKNPAPTDSRLKKWGDYHFGRCLAKYLERQGIDVVTRYHSEWQQPTDADAVLVLRGKHRFRPLDRRVPHFLWIISHPADVGREELKDFDRVFVASTNYAEELAQDGFPALPLLQCTDPEEFYPGSEAPRRDVIFVGNTREQKREIVFWADETGLAPKLWGRGWERFPDAPAVVDSYYDNENLGELYSRARLCLNDHWPDMKTHGLVNNRIFDALACALPVLSDHNPGLDELKLPGVLTYRDKRSFVSAVEHFLFCYPSLSKEADRAVDRVATEFSFAARARTIADEMRHVR